MKLAYCTVCGDGFFLRYELRQCECGRVKGRYINDVEAEVSPSAVSIAIGNGSLRKAIGGARGFQETMAEKDVEPSRDAYIEQGRIWHAWVRPNSGRGNPHTSVLEEVKPK